MKLPTWTGTKIDGIEVAKNVKQEVAQIVENLKSHDVIPCLATVLVGDNSASQTYVKNKHKACEETGIITKDHRPPTETSQNELNELIDMLNDDSPVHGILVQLPLPKHLNEFDTITRILPEKDVDGLTPHNIGLLATGKAVLKPCTPSGIIEMFDYYKIQLEAKKIVIINRSNLVGMGVLPLQFKEGESAQTHGISGNEKFSIEGISSGLKPLSDLVVKIESEDGSLKEIEVICRLDSIVEIDYYYNGGILQTVLRQMIKSN